MTFVTTSFVTNFTETVGLAAAELVTKINTVSSVKTIRLVDVKETKGTFQGVLIYDV